jgi:hypothetical protein
MITRLISTFIGLAPIACGGACQLGCLLRPGSRCSKIFRPHHSGFSNR